VPRLGPCIAVCGPGTADEAELASAEEVGALIAEAGAVLVCGGLGGVMEAACRGARSRGGLTVGLLPGDDGDEANGWVQLALPTGMGEVRNALIVRAAHAVIAIGGAYGTLSEIALALRSGTPVVGLDTWELGGRDAVVRVSSAGEAVRAALAAAAPSV
jgi:uncharacterized protein (TIGR00725 family)